MRPLACPVGFAVILSLASFDLPAQDPWAERDLLPEGGPWAYDPVRGRAVSFYNRETFEWDGAEFVRSVTGLSPNVLAGHALAYDPTRNRTVAVGSGTYLWDGERWMQAAGSTTFARNAMAVAHHGQSGRMLMFGGQSAVVHGDTWEFDGTSWNQLSLATAPPARYDQSMVYDSARGVVVMYGGASRPGWLSDTWEWNGVAWTQVATSGPTVLQKAPMAFDQARQRTILLTDSGGPTETWEWDGMAWTRIAVGGPPLVHAARSSMFYVPSTQRVVLLSDYGVVWQWDGTVWTETHSRRQPRRTWIFGRVMTYDSARRRAVVVHNGETWEWDGRRWELRATSPTPVSFDFSLAFDPLRRVTVLFGGNDAEVSGASLDQTWEWDGVAWARRSPVVRPSARSSAGMAWDSVGQRIVLVGGISSTGANPADTWAWDGATWQQLNPSAQPPVSAGAATTDPVRQRIVLVVNNASFAAETWEWTGTDWINANASAPGGNLAFDPGLNAVVSVGGSTHKWDGASWAPVAVAFGPTPYAGRSGFPNAVSYDEASGSVLVLGDTWRETWSLGQIVAAAASRSGAGCPAASAPRLVGWGTPALGAAGFKLDLLDGAAGSVGAVMFAALPAAVQVLDCTLRLDPSTMLASFPITTSASGHAAFALPVPLWPALAGARLSTQAALLDPSTTNGVSLSNGLALQVGY